jgi:hypothetical protein
MTTNSRTANDSGLELRRDLRLALSTAKSLQASIRHADTKAAALLGIQGGMAAVAADHASSLLHAPSPAALVVGGLLTTTLLWGLGATTWHLALALAPRLAGPPGDNRFAFPNMARSKCRPTTLSVRQQRDEAWDLVSTLAGIAMAKHRRVRRSLSGLAVTTTSVTALLILTVLLGPMA